MEPFWNNRIWDMYIYVYYENYCQIKYALYRYDEPGWVKYASKRFWSTTNKWYGY